MDRHSGELGISHRLRNQNKGDSQTGNEVQFERGETRNPLARRQMEKPSKHKHIPSKTVNQFLSLQWLPCGITCCSSELLRQMNGHGSALPFLALRLDLPAKPLDDAIRDEQTQPCAVSLLFCGKKGFIEALQRLLRHPAAVILNRHRKSLTIIAGAKRYGSSVFHSRQRHCSAS